ncbi:ABC transporter permease [Magnetococcus sp. PR-3]|uniref:ABC transporter permease n=1 Tax=Magnetococcus sp. PR-3 TaxID=3120355 RepID=UPI002FCE1825
MSEAATLTGEQAPETKEQQREARRSRFHARINRATPYLNVTGLGWIVPLMKIIGGESPKAQLGEFWRLLIVPLLAIGLFLATWGALAPQIQTSLGEIPGPALVGQQVVNLYDEHVEERLKAEAFYERQEKRNARKLAKNPDAKTKWRQYTGKPTYFDQIVTSLITVFTGFLIGSLVAIPLGVVCGLSKTLNAAFNPLIQIFKPVSPLAWLPLVTMVVSALYVSDDPMFEKAFLTSAITVTLCSLWPTLINTAVGVASIDKDLMNVGRVLQLTWWTRITKLVMPSSLPYIFTGLRLSLGVGWMVLIAAEMLAQNPGLGKFVWDEFQNGSSQSLAKIMVAVFTIGIIGFVLDRVMLAMQAMVSHGEVR